MIEAEVLIESKSWKKIIPNPKKNILNMLKKFPKNYKFVDKKAHITVLLTNKYKMKLLNKKFRKKNISTDILSFPFFNEKNVLKSKKKRKFYLGDIAISYEDFLKKNKGEYKSGFIKIFIHGFLHLLNFDHKSNRDYKIMSSIESKIFNKVKV